jgi:hypothetical protein
MKTEIVNFEKEAMAQKTNNAKKQERALKNQVKKILVDNGLNFRIEKVPMVGLFGKAKKQKSIRTTYFGLLNTQSMEIINTTKASYHVSQNDDVVELVLRGMNGFGELNVSKAGCLNGGRKTFIQLAIDGFSKVGNDSIKKYITIIDSNDGSTGLGVGISDMVMSCSNQFFRFYKRGEMKLKHSASLEGKMVELPSLIRLALNESMKQIEIYNKFHSTACTQNLVDGLVRELLGVDRLTAKVGVDSGKTLNAMDTLYSHIKKEMNQKGNTIFGLHNGVTSWTNHAKSHPKRENGQLESLSVGTNYRTNMQSFNFALEVTGQNDYVLR